MKFLTHFVFLLGCVSLVTTFVVLAAAIWFAVTGRTKKPERPARPARPTLTVAEPAPAVVVSLIDARAARRRRQNGGAA